MLVRRGKPQTSMTEPANKNVLITGAGGGFGRHLTRQFRAAGAQLILTDIDVPGRL